MLDSKNDWPDETASGQSSLEKAQSIGSLSSDKPTNMMRKVAATASVAARRQATAHVRQAARASSLGLFQATTKFGARPIAASRVLAARSFATFASVFDLAASITAKETSTEARIEALNALQLPSATDVDKLERDRRALELVDSGVLLGALELLKDSDSIVASSLLVPAFLALIRLSTEPVVVQELVRLEAPEFFAHFLRLDDPRLQAAACLALGNVALDPSAEQAVATNFVASAVLHAASSPHEAIKRAAVTCLANIAGGSRGRELLCNPETIGFLAELLENDEFSDSMLSATAFALGNILAGHDIDAQDLIREIGALPQLVMLLSPAFSEETSSSAAWAIHHAVHLNHSSQSLLASAGGLSLLAHHLSAATETLQTNALLALNSAIVSHEENQTWCRSDDDSGVPVVDQLKRIERDESDDLNASAKQALKSLLDQLS